MPADDDEGSVFCRCGRPGRRDGYLACDICDNWFHLNCVGVPKQAAKRIQNFMCKTCKEDGFLGSAEVAWAVEGELDLAVLAAGPAEESGAESSSESESESDGPAPGVPATGIHYRKVEYQDGSFFVGQVGCAPPSPACGRCHCFPIS